MQQTEELTALQWLAPSMVRDGLLKNGDWVLPAAEEAAGLFADEQLRLPAQFLAVLDRYALDYLRQAPVLVVAVTHGRRLKKRSDRIDVGTRFLAECRAGMKLAGLMKAYGMAPQLRALSGEALHDGQHNLLAALSTLVPASTLAQAIPQSPQEQKAWLRGLDSWRSQMYRQFRNANILLPWAATNIRSEEDREAAVDVADFAGYAARRGTTFNQSWNFAQALAASRRWHQELALLPPLQEASHPDWRTSIDYSPLPMHLAMEGHTFHALDTREALFEEGARMHHCVRIYADKVASGYSRIYSVRRDAKRVATLELVRTSRSRVAKPRYELMQLKGPHNAAPAAETVQATQAFIAAVCPATAAIRGKLATDDQRSARARDALRAKLGEDMYASWFRSLDFEAFDGKGLCVSFPVKFLRNWAQTHYLDIMLECCAAGFAGLEEIDIVVRPTAPLRPRRSWRLDER
jgi:hypothetical protein